MTTKSGLRALLLLALFLPAGVSAEPCKKGESENCVAGKAEPEGIVARLLTWLGWGKTAPLITRGEEDARGPDEPFGDIARLEWKTQELSHLTQGQRLRSPLPDLTTQRLFAIGDGKIVILSLPKGASISSITIPNEVRIERLLIVREGMLYALSSDRSILRFDLKTTEVKTVATQISERERAQLLVQVRTCGERIVGVRQEKGPPLRYDVTIRKGRLSKNLTRTRQTRLNADPVFSEDCKQIFFVQRERP